MMTVLIKIHYKLFKSLLQFQGWIMEIRQLDSYIWNKNDWENFGFKILNWNFFFRFRQELEMKLFFSKLFSYTYIQIWLNKSKLWPMSGLIVKLYSNCWMTFFSPFCIYINIQQFESINYLKPIFHFDAQLVSIPDYQNNIYYS